MTDKKVLPSGKSRETIPFTPGIHPMKIKDWDVYKTFEGEPRKDSRGFPGITIVFIGKKNAQKQQPMISGNFYYDPRDFDDPKREDTEGTCKSEWKLMSLRKALGLKDENDMELEEVQKIMFYGQVKRVNYIHPDAVGESKQDVLKSYSELTFRFYLKDAALDKLHIPGDPIDNDGVPSGEFLEIKPATESQLERWGHYQESNDPGTTEKTDPQQDAGESDAF